LSNYSYSFQEWETYAIVSGVPHPLNKEISKELNPQDLQVWLVSQKSRMITLMTKVENSMKSLSKGSLSQKCLFHFIDTSGLSFAGVLARLFKLGRDFLFRQIYCWHVLTWLSTNSTSNLTLKSISILDNTESSLNAITSKNIKFLKNICKRKRDTKVMTTPF